ncbi:MAG: HAMP domain-containing histidine kinase, partial [Thermodesulfovibrionales bacterium]|nr:HAMP domain-containing histidine kinase [Thermodesulfovibrionales bacterium]
SLGEMAAGIAHELRNSMGAISGYMRLLEKRSDPESAGTLHKVSAEVAVMDRIVSDFLSFARPGESKLDDLDLVFLARECVEAFVPEDGPVKVEVAVEAPEDVRVRADEVLLRQMFANLIQNALHATSDGGKVTIAVSSEGEKAVLRISDTGHGMDPAIIDRIFDPFFTTKDKGTGLGLAIVHRIVTSLGGTVDVASSPDGTTFTLTFSAS